MEEYVKILLKWKKLVIEIDFFDGLRLFEVIILLLHALYSDIRFCKIRNKTVFFFMVIGIATNFIFSGYRGIRISLLGIGVPILILFGLFGLRMLGAGDIKLFAAIGSILGWKGAAAAIVYSFISGGVIATFLIIFRKNGVQRIKYLLSYLKTCMLTLSLMPYTDISDSSDNARFRFAFAIVLGTGIVLFMGAQ